MIIYAYRHLSPYMFDALEVLCICWLLLPSVLLVILHRSCFRIPRTPRQCSNFSPAKLTDIKSTHDDKFTIKANRLDISRSPELELVQNAAFTDPDDQAAWFYHRWLLQGRRPAASLVSCSVLRGGQVAVALARPGRPADVGLTLETDQRRVTEWRSPTGETSDTVWVRSAALVVWEAGAATVFHPGPQDNYRTVRVVT